MGNRIKKTECQKKISPWRVIKRFSLSMASLTTLFSFLIVPLRPSIASENNSAAPSRNQSEISTISAAALQPRFNINPDDKEMLRGRNETKGEKIWRDPLSADLGNVVTGLFYFHNDVPNTIAHNTTLKVAVPQSVSSQHKIGSVLDSDETEPIFDTVVNGRVVGLSGLTVNLSSPARLQYVPGSTYLFDADGRLVRSLPDGIVAAGVNIGDIQGCWQFAGTVSFQLKILPRPGQAKLTLAKGVAHDGESNFQNRIEANPADVVVYQIKIQNIGNATAENVTLTDQLPGLIVYIPGSTIIQNAASPNGRPVGDDLFTNGVLLIPNMAAGSAGDTFVYYKARLSHNFPLGDSLLNNFAKVFLAGVLEDQAQAFVHIFVGQPGLEINKTVWNGSEFVKVASARVGDIITYRIIIRNNGNATLQNLAVWDILAINTKPIPGSVLVNNQPAPPGRNYDQLFAPNRLLLGQLPAGVTLTITFKAEVIGCPENNDQLQNTAYALADGFSEKVSSASVKVIVPPTGDPN